MTPPQLPGDVPVPDILHPVLERRAPALGHDLKLVVAVRREHGRRERLHFHEPLIGEARLDDGVTAVAVADRMPVRFDPLQQTALLEHIHDAFARVESVQVGEGLGDARGVLHARVFGHHQRHLELVAQADLEVRRVVGRRDLHEPGPECRIDRLVRDDGNGDVGDGQAGCFPHEPGVPGVPGMHRDGGVA